MHLAEYLTVLKNSYFYVIIKHVIQTVKQGTDMVSYVFLALFAASAAVNLIGAKKDEHTLSNASKPALLLFLCLYAVTGSLPHPDLFLIFALAACWVGDILLMIKGDIWFTAGGVSFFAGHVLLIFAFANRLDSDFNVSVFVLGVSAVYAAAACAVMFCAKNTPKIMTVPMLLYLLCNGAMNAFALLCLIRSKGLTMTVPGPEDIRQTINCAVSYAGAVLFFISDCALFLMRFGDEKKRFYKTNFFVMLTYILGVGLITLGFVPLW